MYSNIMDTFDGSVPNLISKRTLEDIDSYLNVPHIDPENKVINGLGAFYNNYISPNLFPIIVISLLIIYLTIKYILKKDREEKEIIDDEKTEKFDRVKKHIFKTDNNKNYGTNDIPLLQQSLPESSLPLSQLPSQSQHNTNTNAKTTDDLDISELISDEYLLTNDSESNNNNNEIIHDDYANDNFNRAASLIFNTK